MDTGLPEQKIGGIVVSIQLRIGEYADFAPPKLLPGELAVVLSGDPASNSGRTLYVCFAPGIVKRIVSYEDFENELQNATEEIQQSFTSDIQLAIQNAVNATNAANRAEEAANAAAEAANAAAEAAGAYVLGDISDKTVVFGQSAVRENIASGESTATMFGKIKKWLLDLKSVAFSGSYNDLVDKPSLGSAAAMAVANNCTTNVEGSVLDARQGKELKDGLNLLNTKTKPMINVPYIKIKSVVATDKLTFGCAVRSDGAGGTRQVVLVLGSANGVPIHGILHIRSATTAVTWDGNNGVVSASLSGNTVTAVLKQTAYDYIMLISSAEIS